MKIPPTVEARGRWRRRLFWGWVAGSVLVAIYVGVAGPFAHYIDNGETLVALALPALMVFMLATGLGWLVFLAVSRPSHSDRSGDPPSDAHR